MELTAAIMALETLKKPSQVALHTDSEYVKNGISRWIHGWVRANWRNAAKEPVKNLDLCSACWRRPSRIRWSGNGCAGCGRPDERTADRLATIARDAAAQ